MLISLNLRNSFDSALHPMFACFKEGYVEATNTNTSECKYECKLATVHSINEFTSKSALSGEQCGQANMHNQATKQTTKKSLTKRTWRLKDNCIQMHKRTNAQIHIHIQTYAANGKDTYQLAVGFFIHFSYIFACALFLDIFVCTT